jgi:hypothetical protein
LALVVSSLAVLIDIRTRPCVRRMPIVRHDLESC